MCVRVCSVCVCVCVCVCSVCVCVSACCVCERGREGGREHSIEMFQTVNLPTDVHAINNLTVLLVTALPVQCCGVPNPLNLAAS